ncbi:N-acetylmuramoyl-L-alanine amidase [Streptomyces sp. NPDC087422]|uniref:peptidoglycan recognition protein family protein n=1 Tax=Streptomyces sp. NPDC087422 TaxID=3365786 RepID=UPI0038138A0A
MAVPLTADQMLAALRAEGVRVVEHPGWRTHDRAGHGAWGPVHGLIIHHTGGTAPSDGEIVWAGRADLPGPCAHAYLAKGGTLTLTSAGRANHAGGGDPAVLAAVQAESFTTAPPAPHQHEGSAGAVDGNARFYGLECSNRGDGADPWPPAQYDQAVRWAAGICRAHGWSEKSVIGHKEWSDWKPDPGFGMAEFRAAVATRLAHPASWNPTTPEDNEMTFSATDARTNWAFKGSTDKVDMRQYLVSTYETVQRLVATETAQTAAISALAKALSDAHPGVDTAQVVAAVQKAIADAVIHVDVTVGDTTTKES